jgi:hypothetical protein
MLVVHTCTDRQSHRRLAAGSSLAYNNNSNNSMPHKTALMLLVMTVLYWSVQGMLQWSSSVMRYHKCAYTLYMFVLCLLRTWQLSVA